MDLSSISSRRKDVSGMFKKFKKMGYLSRIYVYVIKFVNELFTQQNRNEGETEREAVNERNDLILSLYILFRYIYI